MLKVWAKRKKTWYYPSVFVSNDGVLYIAVLHTALPHIELSQPFNPSRPNPGWREKIKSNFYFHTSLRCLKRFYEDLNGLHKAFWGTTKKCENKNLTSFLFQCNFQKCIGREGLTIFTKISILNDSEYASVYDKTRSLLRYHFVKLGQLNEGKSKPVKTAKPIKSVCNGS